MCELHGSQLITFRINKSRIFQPIYYAPIRQVYKTFNNKYIEVFYNGSWYPAKITGIASEKELYKVNKELLCSGDLIVKTPSGDKKVTELKLNEEYSVNHDRVDKIDKAKGPKYICSIEKTAVVSDWLFGIEFKNPEDQYYSLTNGYIISAK